MHFIEFSALDKLVQVHLLNAGLSQQMSSIGGSVICLSTTCNMSKIEKKPLAICFALKLLPRKNLLLSKIWENCNSSEREKKVTALACSRPPERDLSSMKLDWKFNSFISFFLSCVRAQRKVNELEEKEDEGKRIEIHHAKSQRPLEKK